METNGLPFKIVEWNKIELWNLQQRNVGSDKRMRDMEVLAKRC